MSTAYRPNLERLRYWQGQTLRSVDARDQQRFDALRRALHNRALHGTDGVAFGLAVKIAEDASQGVEVACGVAYDMRGHELILQRSQIVKLPSAPGAQVLRLRKRAAPAPAFADRACVALGGQLLEQDVDVGWVAATELDRAGDVVLARLQAGVLDTLFLPRWARPIARPRLATGATVQGNTAWEPWVIERANAGGTVVTEVVGVQTRIDTSASGFTRTPCYVASLQAPAWDLEKAEFAPAFFAHVAEAAPDGFTFRLLMTEIGRRRFNAWSGLGRVARIARGVGDRLVLEVDAQAAFKVGDVLAQLRPRASAVVVLERIENNQLTLAAPLEQETESLAVANLPRIAKVLKVLPDDPTVVAVFTSVQAVKKGDWLVRSADGALALVDKVSQGTLTVFQPFPAWLVTDALMFARSAGSVAVKSAAVAPDGLTLVLELKPASHTVEPGTPILLLDGAGEPLATSAKVVGRNGATIEVSPVPPAAELAVLARVTPLAQLTITSLKHGSPSTVEIDRVDAFKEGDFVAAADQPTLIARVTKIVASTREMGLSAGLALQPGALIVGADWQGATTIDLFDPKLPTKLTVGRFNVALAGDFVARQLDNEFGTPVPLVSVAGKVLTLEAALDGAARFDTLAVGRFPRIATVVAHDTQGAILSIAESGALRAGDSVLVMAGGEPALAPRAVLQVVSANGATVILSESPGTLAPGARLATVHWRDLLRVTATDQANPALIEVDSAAGLRPGDVLGKLAYHADHANPGFVESVTGNLLTLAPGLEYGDGIVPRGWIDGGIVGPAAVCLPADPSAPILQWQPLLRMENVAGLDFQGPATAYGFDLFTGKYQSRAVLPIIFDQLNALAAFFPQGPEPYRFRPETLAVITKFNSDFPGAFASFAQELRLVVRWSGCQDEFSGPRPCPAQVPYNACGAAAPATISKDA